MGRRPGVVPSLSQEKITEEALLMMDEEGVGAFTIRGLAGRLGVSPMGIYTYFKSKDEIVASVQTRMRQEYDNAPIPGERWDDSLRRTTRSIREVDLAHANAYILLRGWMPEVQFHTRRIFHLHKDQGMPLAVYRPMWSMVEAFLTGFISQEIAQRNAVFAPIDENDPDKDWLAVAETAYTDESFSAGTELIIGGVRELAAPDPCEWRTPLDRSTWTWGT